MSWNCLLISCLSFPIYKMKLILDLHPQCGFAGCEWEYIYKVSRKLTVVNKCNYYDDYRQYIYVKVVCTNKHTECEIKYFTNSFKEA